MENILKSEKLNNVQVVKLVSKILHTMRDGIAGRSESANKKDLAEYYRITNGDDRILDWCDQISKIPDERAAQSMIELTLLPVEGINLREV